jgi:hypothetical protein
MIKIRIGDPMRIFVRYYILNISKWRKFKIERSGRDHPMTDIIDVTGVHAHA